MHGLAILLGRNEAGISNRGKTFLHQAVVEQLNLALPALRDLVLARGRLPRRDPRGLVHVVPEVIQPNLVGMGLKAMLLNTG